MLFSSNFIKIGRLHDQSNKLISSSSPQVTESARTVSVADDESVFEESLEIKMSERNHHYLNDISKLMNEPVSLYNLILIKIIDLFTFCVMLDKLIIYFNRTHFLGNRLYG